MMHDDFKYDVFLSHSTKDKEVVRSIAERLCADGLRVWFDEREIKPGHSISAKMEEGLEDSRVLVLCMSANAFGSDWAQLEAGTFRFRDPLNKDRRFIPLRFGAISTKDTVMQFLCINRRPADCEQEYADSLNAYGFPAKPSEAAVTAPVQLAEGDLPLHFDEHLAFPPRFTLTRACDPYPCGYVTDVSCACTCPWRQVQEYRNSLSGPLRLFARMRI